MKIDKDLMKKYLNLFGVFLIMIDIFLFVVSLVYKMPLMRYVVYAKFFLNSLNFLFIKKEKFDLAVGIMYTVILAFMVSAIMSLGFDYGFQLYVISMIAVVYYTSYLGLRINGKPSKTLPLTTAIIACFAFCFIWNIVKGPMYEIDESIAYGAYAFNSILVIGIITVYMKMFLNVVIESEDKLSKLALVDNLTGLYNRHYLLARMESAKDDERDSYRLAIMDIDNFKKVNDIYGHNCGDEVLKTIASKTKEICGDCIVSRWGGEEFIVIGSKDKLNSDMLENLRKTIAETEITYDDKSLNVTVTIGVAEHKISQDIEKWIEDADSNLYKGKNSGKNKVVFA